MHRHFGKDHAIAPGYQRFDPAIEMTQVYMVIARLMPKSVVSKSYLRVYNKRLVKVVAYL